MAVHTGEVVRVRTIHRLLAEKQRNAEAVLTMRATPRIPWPREDPELRLEGDREERLEVVRIARPGHQDAHGAPRELRIHARLLGKYGFTDGCSGCMHRQLGLGTRRAHSNACRKRIYELMAADPDELERMVATDQRLGRAQLRDELTRRAKQDFPTDPQADETPLIRPKTHKGGC